VDESRDLQIIKRLSFEDYQPGDYCDLLNLYEVQHSYYNIFVSARVTTPACGEPHRLISEDIICALQKVFSVDHLKFRPSFFPYNKEGLKNLYSIEPVQIPVATVKNIASKRLVVNPVHGIHIMHSCFCEGNRWFDWKYICHCSLHATIWFTNKGNLFKSATRFMAKYILIMSK